MSDPAAAREELAKVSSLVLTARRLLAGGTLVDLSAIEDRVRAICGSVETMPLEDSRPLADDLRALMARLDQLEREVRDHLDQLTQMQDGS